MSILKNLISLTLSADDSEIWLNTGRLVSIAENGSDTDVVYDDQTITVNETPAQIYTKIVTSNTDGFTPQ